MDKIYVIVTMQVEPGARERFLDCVQATMVAARADLTGTSAYEWFLSEDGCQATVIEMYDGAEGLAHHGRMVGQSIAPLLALAKFRIEFAGAVPAAAVVRSQSLGRDASFFGPRLQGRFNSAAPGCVSANVGNKVFALARFSILPGHEAEFQAEVRQIFAQVEQNEPGTLGYEWFFNAAGTECLVLEVYADAAGLAAHSANVGGLVPRLRRMATCQVGLFGAVPESMRTRFSPAMGIAFVAPQIAGVL